MDSSLACPLCPTHKPIPTLIGVASADLSGAGVASADQHGMGSGSGSVTPENLVLTWRGGGDDEDDEDGKSQKQKSI